MHIVPQTATEQHLPFPDLLCALGRMFIEGCECPCATTTPSPVRLCRCQHAGRRRAEEITLFKSVGSALEDLAAASLAYDG